MVNYVLQNLDQPLDVESLARIGCFSPFHFHRVFRGMLGETLMEMVRRLRLERAALTLLTTESRVLELALDNGYESGEALTRAFRTAYGGSPTEIKRRNLASHRIPSLNRVHFEPNSSRLVIPQFSQGEINVELQFKQLPARRAVVMAHTGPYWQIGATFGKFMGWVEANQVPMQECVAFYYNDPEVTPQADLKSSAGAFVPDGFEPNHPDVSIVEVPAGEYVTTLHHGSYEGLGQTWSVFYGQAIPATGRTMDKVCYELYHSGGNHTAPETLVTELVQGVAPN